MAHGDCGDTLMQKGSTGNAITVDYLPPIDALCNIFVVFLSYLQNKPYFVKHLCGISVNLQDIPHFVKQVCGMSVDLQDIPLLMKHLCGISVDLQDIPHFVKQVCGISV